MLAALEQAVRRAGLAARLTTECRDLQRVPLAGAELDRFDARGARSTSRRCPGAG